ncbi:MAG: FAD-dependent oxidoreductase [Brevinema sp.]
MFFRSLMLCVFFVLTSCSSVYEGESPSFFGSLTVEAHIKWGGIRSYKILSHSDSSEVVSRAFPLLEERILKEGHPMVDSVSGASISSQALKNALASAQRQDPMGRLRLAFTMDKTLPAEDFSERRDAFQKFFKSRRTKKVDVLVIGGGAAGVAAALSAKEQNPDLSVMLLEKLEILGGNAKFTRNLFDIVQSQAQLRAGVMDTADDLYQDKLNQMQQNNIPVDQARLRVFADGSASLDSWLRSHDIALDYLLARRGVMESPEDYAGNAIMNTLEKKLETAGVEVLLGTGASDIDFSKKIVKAENRKAYFTIHANAVIMTAGGFAANKEMVVAQDSTLEDFDNSNSMGNTGDLHLIASNQGLPLDGMNSFSIFNYTLTTRELTGDNEEGTEYVLVNNEGERFIDEYDTQNIAQAIKAQDGAYAYLVFDEQTLQTSPRLRAHIRKDRGYSGEEIDQLEMTALESTLQEFNKTARSKGRRPLVAPFYALDVEPRLHMTRGGLRVDEQSRLLNNENLPVQGFYAAGEVTDMPFGALLGSLVFGIDAGKNAVKQLEAKP